MKTIVAGSRTMQDPAVVKQALLAVKRLGWKITEVVSGCARGVDTIGAEIARQYGIPVCEMPADWDKLGKSAGYLRNQEMARYADALVAVWNGHSKGTKHMIDTMEYHGKLVFIYDYLNPEKSRVIQPC
jgi:lactate dehydrogenase-like 2-hydroxyacid dehydrogenase